MFKCGLVRSNLFFAMLVSSPCGTDPVAAGGLEPPTQRL
jgi:hypothetical protein